MTQVQAGAPGAGPCEAGPETNRLPGHGGAARREGAGRLLSGKGDGGMRRDATDDAPCTMHPVSGGSVNPERHRRAGGQAVHTLHFALRPSRTLAARKYLASATCTATTSRWQQRREGNRIFQRRRRDIQWRTSVLRDDCFTAAGREEGILLRADTAARSYLEAGIQEAAAAVDADTAVDVADAVEVA